MTSQLKLSASAILGRLGTVSEEGKNVYKPSLVSETKFILSKFDGVQKEVKKLVSEDRRLKRPW